MKVARIYVLTSKLDTRYSATIGCHEQGIACRTSILRVKLSALKSNSDMLLTDFGYEKQSLSPTSMSIAP
jgi:hypothetical protein